MNSEDIDGAIAQHALTLPYIDGQQPYGDHSPYLIAIAELLGEPCSRNR
jgi:hypothetical protein